MGPRCGRTSKTNMGRTSFKWRAVAAPDFTAIMRATVCATIMERTVVPITAITGRITDRTTTGRTVTGRNQPELDCDGISAERRMSANGAERKLACEIVSFRCAPKAVIPATPSAPPVLQGPAGSFSAAFCGGPIISCSGGLDRLIMAQQRRHPTRVGRQFSNRGRK